MVSVAKVEFIIFCVLFYCIVSVTIVYCFVPAISGAVVGGDHMARLPRAELRNERALRTVYRLLRRILFRSVFIGHKTKKYSTSSGAHDSL